MTILGFLQGKEKDNKGRYLFDYWEADNQWLEETHNYIQWMFPLDKRSFHHPFVAPALKEYELEMYCKKFNITKAELQDLASKKRYEEEKEEHDRRTKGRC